MTLSERDAFAASECFNVPFVAYTSDVLTLCRDGLNDVDLDFFNTWYSGACDSAFWDSVSDVAYSRIMAAISYGLG
jgi:hypothetical protein